MSERQPGSQNDGALETTAISSGDEMGRLRVELHEAILAQERLQAELQAAVSELSRALPREGSEAVDRGDAEMRRLERRLRAVELDLAQASEQLTGILGSRIWRTLVAAGGLLVRLRGGLSGS